MLVKLGQAIVDSDEVVYARAHGDGLSIEVLFKSHSKIFSGGKSVLIDSDDPEKDIKVYLECLERAVIAA